MNAFIIKQKPNNDNALQTYLNFGLGLFLFYNKLTNVKIRKI